MPDRLLDHLMEDHSTIDPTYVEDYLLTYVIFHKKPHELAAKLLKWFDRGQLKDKVRLSAPIHVLLKSLITCYVIISFESTRSVSE